MPVPKTFHIVSLGCPKNRVDTEIMWAGVAQEGWAAVDDPAQAEVIIVNTCAFVRSAVQESIDSIVKLGGHKRDGRCRLLVVAGCLTARYRHSLLRELPEVDLFIGPAEVEKLPKLILRSLQKPRTPTARGRKKQLQCAEHKSFLPRATTPRVNSLSAGAAYLKVAEGCSRQCAFCVIPALRGPQRSRPVADLVREAEALTRLGVREIVLVAQDLANYGRDLRDWPDLADLVEALSEVPDVRWLRLMYLFPTKVPERLIRLVIERKNVLPYLDVPFQHADAAILRRMNRGGDRRLFGELVARFRGDIPGVVLRSSLMTGFPGESEKAFQRLVGFVEECRFERLGVFAFSLEEGSAAASFTDIVSRAVAEKRRDELMRRQMSIALDYHRSLVGKRLEVLVEERLAGGEGCGRSWNQAPEVDGETVIRGSVTPGRIVSARVVSASAYDLEVEATE